ncbi:DUF4126 domain-containing protein [Moraxella pluranimalium]|uniref:DUF4126 domain-containing protein n=1 Tax=Moraxella pluranimalium TaxID=470453 RepID=A0A1T0CMW5_9GAMM|nr:DUF4126 domain-containing protein [Moraxella pluranimalium]OOS23501.1 hypothetical protein B0680_05925 [Moraxella pluranimalium]
MTAEMIISICLGIGLAASTGFRVFVPLFGLSLAAYFGIIPLNETWAWVGSLSALIILGVASVVESISYLVPVVDNLLDTIAVPLAGVAGTLVMASTLTDMSPAMTWALAIVAGGGAAATIKTTSAATRAVSTATTAGVANPVFGVAETGAAIGLSALSIFVPVLGFVAVLIAFFGLIWLGLRIKRKMAQSS